MKILLINKYFYKKGGAELVFFDTAQLLKDKGHDVMFFSMKHPNNLPSEYEPYFVSQKDYDDRTLRGAWRSAHHLLYSWEARRKLDKLLDREKPDVAHVHNIYHQLSPSILHSLKKRGIPVVMTLHDYKLVCASYSMLAQGKICEACDKKKYQNCFLRACVKGSRIKSLLNTAEMYLHHNILDIYGSVARYVSPSRFLKGKIETMGFKGHVDVLPNFVDAGAMADQAVPEERTIVYFGRLSKEKGVSTLLDAVRGLDVTLKIIGDGPLREELVLKANQSGMTNVRFLGHLTGERLKSEVASSRFVVVPSEWYENNPRSVLEAFALKKPVIGSNVGGIPELVRSGETGYLFQMGNATDLKDKISKLLDSVSDTKRMGEAARAWVEKECNAAGHYERLMGIYRSVMKAA